jgi:hypothetical protein
MMSFEEGVMPVVGKHKRDEETVSLLRTAASDCSSLAIRQAKEYGLTVTVVEGDRIVKVAPNGAKTELKVLRQTGAHLTKGSKITYR